MQIKCKTDRLPISMICAFLIDMGKLRLLIVTYIKQQNRSSTCLMDEHQAIVKANNGPSLTFNFSSIKWFNYIVITFSKFTWSRNLPVLTRVFSLLSSFGGAHLAIRTVKAGNITAYKSRHGDLMNGIVPWTPAKSTTLRVEEEPCCFQENRNGVNDCGKRIFCYTHWKIQISDL